MNDIALMSLAVNQITSALRGCKWFGFIDQTSKGKVLAVAAVISGLVNITVAIVLGTLTQTDVAGFMDILQSSLFSFVGAVSFQEVASKVINWIKSLMK